MASEATGALEVARVAGISPRMCRAFVLLGCGALALPLIASCGSDRDGFGSTHLTDPAKAGFGGGGDGSHNGGLGPGDGDGPTSDPISCDAAAESKSYVGCDYWPTITPNPVWSIFDYAVVVANTGDAAATVTITGPLGTNETTSVPAGELRKIYLPWVPELKGGDCDSCGMPPKLGASSIVPGGAYHLVSSVPVIVYQFNALEYKGQGGAPGKDWSACPGSSVKCGKQLIGCYSFSNDASLLLPSTAMTNHYRVMGYKGASAAPFPGAPGVVGPVLSITTTAPETRVTVQLAPGAKVLASKDGETIAESAGGQTLTFSLAGAGDVVQLVTDRGEAYDFSGSLVASSKPVQVIASVPCVDIPSDKQACDHIEETVLPAETLGRRYVVTPPTGPKGAPVAHAVRLYGNKDGTRLTFQPVKPAGCPDALDAGQVADCGIVKETEAFEVTGDKEFGVATFLLGAAYYDRSGADRRGDPDQSQFAAVEQFRTKYVFLAPDDYPVRFADVVGPVDANVKMDGAPVDAPWTMIGQGPFGVQRIDLTKTGRDGAHTLTADKPVGVQVIGFGDNTSFQVPAGLDLKLISTPPMPK
jgi:hypothetical protein